MITQPEPAELDTAAADSVDLPRQPGPLYFWNGPVGQRLIERSGGKKSSTILSGWLAQTYPHLYGSEAGLNNLHGQKNTGVAAFVQVIDMMYEPDSEECKTLAAALEQLVEGSQRRIDRPSVGVSLPVWARSRLSAIFKSEREDQSEGGTGDLAASEASAGFGDTAFSAK
jgi:hypothetical protein